MRKPYGGPASIRRHYKKFICPGFVYPCSILIIIIIIIIIIYTLLLSVRHMGLAWEAS
jgi:hypothetical protein